MTIKAGILGATGYTGAELTRLLTLHPGVELTWLTSEKFKGMGVCDAFPSLRGMVDLEYSGISTLGSLGGCDVVFSCLPNGSSMHFVPGLLERGMRVVDLGSDFRYKDPIEFEAAYGLKHAAPALCDEAVYGLPEINRKGLAEARLIANPGCYATGVVLALAPLASAGLIETLNINIDTKAGLSGAGRAPGLHGHFPEANENVSSEGAKAGKQGSEIERVLGEHTGRFVSTVFVMSRVPVSRGILTTTFTRIHIMGDTDGRGRVREVMADVYAGERFVRVYDKPESISIKNVNRSNYIDISASVHGETVVVVTALDNLGKGASGQAVQNMNGMFGFDEDAGLEGISLFP